MKYEETNYLGHDDVEMFMRKWTPDGEIKGAERLSQCLYRRRPGKA